MVYFTCGACGEQIKKPNVEKHYTQKCRRCEVLTCIDCLKDFYGDEYKAHNQCMSEDQRYSKEGRNGYDPSVGQNNKGDKKQQAWIGKLRSVLETTDNIDSDVRGVCDVILNHENIPRKKPKFINFVKNIMRQKAQPSTIDKTWDLFSQALLPNKEEAVPARNGSLKVPEDAPAQESKKEKKTKKRQVETAAPNREEEEAEPQTKKSKKNKKNKKQPTEGEEERMEMELKKVEEMEVEEGRQDKGSKKKERKRKRKAEEEEEGGNSANADKENEGGSGKDKKRKRKAEEEEEEGDEGGPQEKRGRFDWDEVITSLLRQKEEMKLNKLKKRCVAEFMALHPATHKTEEQIGAKFDKKIAKKKYRVLKDRVRLAHPEDAAQAVTMEQTGEAEPTPQTGSQSAGPETIISFNKWEATSLGNEAQTEKFRRLMGIKTTKPPEAIASQKRDDKKIFRDLEQGFEKARHSHFSAKGRGLGFNQ